MNSRLRYSSSICPVYEIFGECCYGERCANSHNDWPYSTRKEVVTVGPQFTINILPGVVEFIKKDTRNFSKCQYYVSRGPWFDAGAKRGDSVEILISEKIDRASGCHHARITKIRVPSTGIRVASGMPGNIQKDCREFIMHNDCQRGGNCRYRHDFRAAHKQHFRVAKILSVDSFQHYNIVEAEYRNGSGSITNIKYQVPLSTSKYVQNGNLIILQESEQMHRSARIRFAKIIAILHHSQDLSDVDIPLEEYQRFAFTLEAPADGITGFYRKSTMAYSVESCCIHDDCQKIGVHVIATALGKHFEKLGRYFVPLHRVHVRNQPGGFDVDSIRLALTVYAHSPHTASNNIEGPCLTPVSVPRECAYTFDDAPKYQGYLKHMWASFGEACLFDSVANSVCCNYVVDFPEIWKVRCVTYQIMNFFNKTITGYLRSKKIAFVISKDDPTKHGISENDDVVVPAESVKLVERLWQSPRSTAERKEALGFLIGRAKRCEEDFWVKQCSGRYQYDVITCADLTDAKSVTVTSPIGQTADFLNQQIALSLMITPGKELYTKDEISGILARRQETPVVLKTVVRRLSTLAIYLQYCGVFGRRRGNRHVLLEEIFKGTNVNYSFPDGSENNHDTKDNVLPVDCISFVLEGLKCDEYCNTELVRLSGKRVAALTNTALVQGVDATDTAASIRDLVAGKSEYSGPYEAHERGTLVTLGRGVELQLQVTVNRDDDDVYDGSRRLLRVGKGCHLCLVHINYPRWAFDSQRTDVNMFNIQSSIDEVEKKVAEKRLKTFILPETIIRWNDMYFSGGSFTADVHQIEPQSLLCIRREIFGSKGNLSLVWTCHAIVSDVIGDVITFLVCSLFQDQTPDMCDEDERFIVEVINVREDSLDDSAGSGCTSSA